MGLQWRDQLSVGNDLIDNDHKYLIEIVNKAEDHLKANSRVAVMAVLDELTHYGQTHFEREERVAKAVGYPKADQLHESHIALVASLQQLKSELGESWTEEAQVQFTTFLRDWLIQHVIKEDILMKPWMSNFHRALTRAAEWRGWVRFKVVWVFRKSPPPAGRPGEVRAVLGPNHARRSANSPRNASGTRLWPQSPVTWPNHPASTLLRMTVARGESNKTSASPGLVWVSSYQHRCKPQP